MSIFEEISSMYSIDSRESPAEKEEISKLLNYSTIEVPFDYIEFISIATEVEIKVKEKMYIRIWGPVDCIEMNEAYHIQKYIPRSLAIGDDEGGNVIIYLEGEGGLGLYMVGFGDLDINDAVKVAPTLRDLLVDNIGIEVIMSGYV
ncbi:SMI1/KNR4 family protein [Paenibacillus sp. FSL R5-0912]|uniref:SMI1/KNR4 family protein n=1 Tax=Paenibacillus sp. FSL R5-0912 TaxID=1536771 RepID=UPI0004F92C6E|nr:SMI1/KNR4 family protein [Paenibacillus sp. FSL R5-0912]AIQ42162.1 SMI1 / KNR4 [Paenibacillus sp. FSL R5-0912]